MTLDSGVTKYHIVSASAFFWGGGGICTVYLLRLRLELELRLCYQSLTFSTQ